MKSVMVKVLADGTLLLPAGLGKLLGDVEAFMVTREDDSIILVPQRKAAEELIKRAAFQSLAVERFLEGELSFENLAQIVGYERAEYIRKMDRALKEGIQSAKKAFGE